MHHGDRRHSPHGLGERLPRLIGVRPASLDAQQRCDRLQVVLDPVVDLADGRILGDELLLLVAQLRHVAAQHDRADAGPVVAERNRPQRHRDSASLDVGAPRRPPAHHERQRLVELALGGQDARRHLAEGLPLQLVVESHAIERGQRVGARERGDAVHVEADETVRCAGRPAAGRGRCGQIREVAGGDHAEQIVGAVVERDLLTRRGACLAQIGVPREHADRRVPPRRRGCAGSARHGRASESPRTSPATRSRRCERSGTPPAPACATGAARGRRRCPGRTASRRRPDACARPRRRSRPRWAPRSRCRRTRDLPAADRRRRGGGATRRRLRSTDPGRRRDR